MGRILPVKNTTWLPDPEVEALVRWTERTIGGKTGLVYAEVLHARQGQTHSWRFRTKGKAPGAVVRLSAQATYPILIQASAGSEHVVTENYRETLVACAAMSMCYARDYRGHKGKWYDHIDAILQTRKAVLRFKESQAEVEALIAEATTKHAEREEAAKAKKARAESWPTKREKLSARLETWQSKKRRAETAIKKLNRQIKAGDRYHESKA